MTRLDELLATPPGSLRGDEWAELQRLASDCRQREQAAEKDAARMREIDALVSGGRLLDRGRLWKRMYELSTKNNPDDENYTSVDGADLAIETVQVFAAAMLSKRALAAADEAFCSAVDNGEESDDTRAAIRAAMREAADVEVDALRNETYDALTSILSRYVGETGVSESAVEVMERKLAELKTEKARVLERRLAEHAEKIRADKAEAALTVNKELVRAARVWHSVAAERSRERHLDLTPEAQALMSAIDGIGVVRVKPKPILPAEQASPKPDRCICNDLCPVHWRENRLQERVEELRARVEELESQRDGWSYATAVNRARADVAEDALRAMRAEVAALRAMSTDPNAAHAVMRALNESKAGPHTRAEEAIRAALATVPPAKVADAAESASAVGGSEAMSHSTTVKRAPAPEPLSMLVRPPTMVLGALNGLLSAITDRINELSRRENERNRVGS